MKPLVIGLGQCCLDFLGQIECYPELDQKAEIDGLLIQGGGPVATALVTLSRLGVPVAMTGAVGDDQFGEQIRDGLLQENVDCTFLEQQAETSSQLAFITVDAEGHRNIFWHRGTATPSVPEGLSKLLSNNVRVLHLDGLHLEPAVSAAKMAKEYKVQTVLDAGTLRPGVERLLPLIDHLVVSEKFAAQYIGQNQPEAALMRLAGSGAGTVVVTMGENGCLALDQERRIWQQPAFQVEVLDTTGCGDVFHGGYIYGLLQQWPLHKILRFASACAALKACAPGGRTGIPKLARVNAFLQGRPESC